MFTTPPLSLWLLALSVTLLGYCDGLLPLCDWFFPLWLRLKSYLQLVDAIGEAFVDWRRESLQIVLVH
ncbi:hypothetical protein DVH24_003231 [Malus domestica]|uniref:Uncharacterized protein n=1 Tax=Malus domestica TaxID=3750 RepID=A0A498INC4_MALDO|nr:hypothetical protein DVH24_003231 [Malus domestica]